MFQVKDGKIISYQLPTVGQLKDGSSVSGYDILMKSDLELARQEGWLPLEDIKPEYNQEIQYIMSDGYGILEDKVLVKYRVEDIVIEEPMPQEPSELDLLKDENEKLKAKIHEMDITTAETSSTQQDLVELLIDMGVI